MFKLLKNTFYFTFASYFRFFAKIQLALWKPQIIVVTGSNGKTTLLHLVESQIKERAKYSHHANSSFGIPFDILGLKRSSFAAREWVYLFLAAPFRAFKKPYSEKIYIVEADCDRPGEGKFLATLLKPTVTIWLSLSRTHSMNFDGLVQEGKFPNVEEAIAYEFGHFLVGTKHLVIVNGDNQLIAKHLKRTKTPLEIIAKAKELEGYTLSNTGTEFIIAGNIFSIPYLLPEEVFYSVAALGHLLKFLNLPRAGSFKNFFLPPGRSSVFLGIKNTTLVDSSYNANLDSMKAVLAMFEKYHSPTKWVVLGDFLEQGKQEKEEHERLAELVVKTKLSKIILMGPRVCKYTYPKLQGLVSGVKIEKFETPKEALDYIEANILGGEVILFKGARFLEGVIEHLLADKNEVAKLCRREPIWQARRKEWGL